MSGVRSREELLRVDDEGLSDEELRVKYAPVHFGPTWDRGVDGSWRLPEFTLGWECLGWCSDYLAAIGEGAGPGEPFMATLEQARFLLWWFAVDEQGNFVYRNGVLQRVKGWGKDPVCAVLALIEAFGPSRFAGWDDDGFPIGRRCSNPWVQIVAVSQSQTVNTMTMFPLLVTPQLVRDYKVEVKKEVVYGLQGKARIEAVTSSPQSIQGQRSTLVILNETQHWTPSNGGKLLYETIDGNATKMKGRHLQITNAPDPSEDSVALASRNGYLEELEGRQVPVGVLYDSLEAPSFAPLSERVFKLVFEMVRGDSVWLDPESTWLSVANPVRSVSQSRRMYYNQTWTPDAALYQPSDWDRLRVDGGLADGDEVCLGFDGGRTDDATALVALRVRDCLIVPLGVWERPDGPAGDGWVVPRGGVDAAVAGAFDKYNVVGFYADVALWESFILDWGRQFGAGLKVRAGESDPIGWDMRGFKKATFAHEKFVAAIRDGKVSHNGDLALRRHVLNVYRRDTRWGVSFQKESRESKKKVDLYAAAMLAYTAWRDLVAPVRPHKGGRVSGRIWFS